MPRRSARLLQSASLAAGLLLLACGPNRPSIEQNPPRSEELTAAKVSPAPSPSPASTPRPSASPAVASVPPTPRPDGIVFPTVQPPRLAGRMDDADDPRVPPSGPLVPRGTLVQAFPDLVDLSQARTRTFAESWIGMPGHRVALYALARVGDHFEAHASWITGNPNGRDDTSGRHREFEFQVAADVVEGYLRSLAQLPVAEGRPAATFDDTDDYPSSEYIVGTNQGDLSIYTIAQGDWRTHERRPWAVEYRGTRMVIDSNGPQRAFASIAPQLRWEEFLQFHRQFINDTVFTRRGQASPSPSPSPGRSRR